MALGSYQICLNGVNKIITSVGRYAVKKVVGKAVDKFIEKSSEPYRKLKRAAFQIKPLNVGERETIQCLRNPKNSLDYCKSVGDKARITYRKTSKY